MRVEINNKSRAKIDERQITDLLNFFVKLYSLKEKEISIAIVGDTVMSRLNNNYRGMATPTDILSFDGEGDFFGELIIDYSQVKRQSPYFSKKTNEEFLFIIIHGLLHLIGHDDKEEVDRKFMIDKGKDLLKSFLNK